MLAPLTIGSSASHSPRQQNSYRSYESLHPERLEMDSDEEQYTLRKGVKAEHVGSKEGDQNAELRDGQNAEHVSTSPEGEDEEDVPGTPTYIPPLQPLDTTTLEPYGAEGEGQGDGQESQTKGEGQQKGQAETETSGTEPQVQTVVETEADEQENEAAPSPDPQQIDQTDPSPARSTARESPPPESVTVQDDAETAVDMSELARADTETVATESDLRPPTQGSPTEAATEAAADPVQSPDPGSNYGNTDAGGAGHLDGSGSSSDVAAVGETPGESSVYHPHTYTCTWVITTYTYRTHLYTPTVPVCVHTCTPHGFLLPVYTAMYVTVYCMKIHLHLSVPSLVPSVLYPVTMDTCTATLPEDYACYLLISCISIATKCAGRVTSPNLSKHYLSSIA